jgi:hypothetical protein
MRMLSLPANFVKISVGSKRSELLATAVMSVMAILLTVSVFVAKRSSAHGVNPAKKKQRGCCSDQPAISRRMIGTYYTTEDGFQSNLVLNNKGPNQIMVTLILHSQNGQTFTASPVAVSSQSSSEVDLNLLAQVAGPQFRSGSFEFTYEGRILEVGGGLRIVNAEKSLIFDEQMLEPGMKFPSSRLEAVYAVPFEDSQVSVIVTNTTAQPIIVNGDAIFAGANSHHPIQSALGPYETQVVNLPHGLVKEASAGALSLNHNGAKGALLAMIHLQDAGRGYSEAVNFTDPGDKTTERHGAGLRLGSINNDPLRPVIAVRNIGESATTVAATVPYSKQNGETGTISLPEVSLAPDEIKLLDTSNPQLRRNDFATAGLEIKYTGAPGGVIASASSVSRSGNHVFTLPMKDPKSGLSSTGGYPWFIDEKGSTVVFIKNSTETPQQFHLDIIFPGGQWGSNLRTLAPGQTFKLDVREVRDSQVKGSEGNTIPLEAIRGHVYWSAFGTSEKVLIGRAQTVYLAGGMASTYECQVCTCPASFAGSRMEPSTATGFPGDVRLFLPQEQDQNCFGPLSSWFNVPGGATFSSTNPSVATIDSGGSATCVAPGSTTLYAAWTGTVYFSSGGDGCEVQYVEANPGASCDVADVTISGAANCMDGGSADFSVTVTGGTAQSYQWSFEAPSGAGNNPNVQFGSPGSASTSATCHWFANPNQECATEPPKVDASHPYYNAVYDIKCTVTFSDGKSKTKGTKLTVNAWWNPAGATSNAKVDGNLQIGFDAQRNLWYVVGPGSLARTAPGVTINIPTSSQFNDKTRVHENKHVEQWKTGLFSDLLTVNGLMQVLSPLTDPTQSGLAAKVIAAKTNWEDSQEAIYRSRLNQAEREAFVVSDPVSPKFAYQRCGRFE